MKILRRQHSTAIPLLVQAITPEGTKLKLRLYGIDAPETPKGNKPGEPFGNASRDYLAALVSQRSVRVEILDIDRYRRIVAILWMGGEGGTGNQGSRERGLVPG